MQASCKLFGLVCTVRKLITDKIPGDLLWNFRSNVLLQTVKSQLDLLGDSIGASLLTWKSWRAGKATQLANDGYGLGSISECGEWSKEGKSYDRYCDIDSVNPTAVLGAVLDAFDDER